METTGIIINADQKSDILKHMDEISNKNLTLKALFSSIHAIVENEINCSMSGHKGQPIEGIPYLIELAEITGKEITTASDKIFLIMHNKA